MGKCVADMSINAMYWILELGVLKNANGKYNKKRETLKTYDTYLFSWGSQM